MYRVSNLLWNSWCQFRLLAILLLGVSGVTHANPLKEPSASGETRQYGWIYVCRAAPDQTVSFRIYPHQPRRAEFSAIAKDVSNPRSDNYRRYMTMEEIHEFLKLPESTHTEIREWLESATIQDGACTKDWDHYLCKDMPVSLVERLLNVRINTYHHDVMGEKSVLMTEDEEQVPPSVKAVIGVEFHAPDIITSYSKRRR